MTDPLELLPTARMATFAMLVVAIVFSTTGELFLKTGMNRVGHFELRPDDLVRTFLTPAILVGFALFGTGAVFWLYVLSRADLSWAYPMLAMGYLLVVLESRVLLGETVTPQRWLGAVVIVIGVVIMYGSAPEAP